MQGWGVTDYKYSDYKIIVTVIRYVTGTHKKYRITDPFEKY